MGDGCASKTFFLGQQYILNDDGTTILLFDRLGQIAGIQFSAPNTLEIAKHHSSRENASM